MEKTIEEIGKELFEQMKNSTTNSCTCDDKIPEAKDDNWYKIFLPLLATMPLGNNEDVPLKQEVAYLRGKVDVLEEILLKKIH